MSDPRPFPIPVENTPPPLDPGEPGAAIGVSMLVAGLLLGTVLVLVGLHMVRRRRLPGGFFATPVGSAHGPTLDELDGAASQSRGASIFWFLWGAVFLGLGLGLWGTGLYGLGHGLIW